MVEDELTASRQMFLISIPCLELRYGYPVALGDFLYRVVRPHQID